MPIFFPLTLYPFSILNSGSHDFPAVDSLAAQDVSPWREDN